MNIVEASRICDRCEVRFFCQTYRPDKCKTYEQRLAQDARPPRIKRYPVDLEHMGVEVTD